MDKLKHFVAYFSRTLGKHERNYSITRKKLLVVIEGIEHFRCYLYGRQFVLRPDLVTIQRLKNFKNRQANLRDGSNDFQRTTLLFNIDQYGSIKMLTRFHGSLL